ncbi:hypothetical protein BJ741DRAFT_602258 [Chytriomyces cf. hyalinus JEL632]|nr:hypothetical protein BJ741DRAFT_602258 [Chytriomyces cf. hyalinus JEL632]
MTDFAVGCFSCCCASSRFPQHHLLEMVLMPPAAWGDADGDWFVPMPFDACLYFETDHRVLLDSLAAIPTPSVNVATVHPQSHYTISADAYLRDLLSEPDETRFHQQEDHPSHSMDHFQLGISPQSTPEMVYTITPQQHQQQEHQQHPQQPHTPARSESPTPAVLTKKPNRKRTQRVRTFQCSHCPAYFWRKQDAQRHEVTHGSAKEFKCPNRCGKSFARQDALGRHLKSSKCNWKNGKRR